MRRVCTWLCAAAILGSAACAAPDNFVWVDQLPESYAAPHAGFVIAAGDMLNIRVWNQDNVSGRYRVRDDGQISMLFINDVQAAGKTPQDLAREIELRLKDYLAKPVVSVSVEEARPLTVSVLGEVTHPGSYSITGSAVVLQALASAGGLTEFANKDRIFVLRQVPIEGSGKLGGDVATRSYKIRFTLQALTGTVGLAPQFRLQSGDVVVVE